MTTNEHTLPANILAALPELSPENVACAYAVASYRAALAPAGSKAAALWRNRAHAIDQHLFARGYRLVRWERVDGLTGYYPEQFGPAA
jgi:hypothetical protein